VIETPRFILRPLEPGDATERYSRWFDADADFIVAAKSSHSVDDLRAYIEERIGRDDVLFLGIYTRDDRQHIGTLKYEPIDREERYAVMGIFIGERDWRSRGVAAEVIRASAFWLRENCGIDTIVLGVDRNNARAIKAFGKIGFVVEPSDRIPPRTDGSFAMVWRLEQNPMTSGDAT
jgi:RimJ/RimL family protein N-acetyltransferase